MTWHDAARTIAGFATLTDDWDGQGAIAPKPSLILKALSLLIELHDAHESNEPIHRLLPPPSRVGACPMGGILFEWQTGMKYLEVEITPAGALEWMEERKGQPVRHGTGTPDGKIEWTKETR